MLKDSEKGQDMLDKDLENYMSRREDGSGGSTHAEAEGSESVPEKADQE